MVSTYAIAELAVKLLRWALCAADVADRLRDGRLARDKKAMTQQARHRRRQAQARAHAGLGRRAISPHAVTSFE
jgi:hypothetical protein